MSGLVRGALGRWVAGTSRRAAWAPCLVFGLHVVASKLLGLYERWPPLDLPMHFAGGVAIAYFTAHSAEVARREGLLGEPSRIALLLLVFTSACSAAVFWEFAEFLSDRWLGTRAQAGHEDTLSDMALGVVGALAYLALARVPAVGTDTVGTESGARKPSSPLTDSGRGGTKDVQA